MLCVCVSLQVWNVHIKFAPVCVCLLCLLCLLCVCAVCVCVQLLLPLFAFHFRQSWQQQKEMQSASCKNVVRRIKFTWAANGKSEQRKQAEQGELGEEGQAAKGEQRQRQRRDASVCPRHKTFSQWVKLNASMTLKCSHAYTQREREREEGRGRARGAAGRLAGPTGSQVGSQKTKSLKCANVVSVRLLDTGNRNGSVARIRRWYSMCRKIVFWIMILSSILGSKNISAI